jgi:hypothetical protein
MGTRTQRQGGATDQLLDDGPSAGQQQNQVVRITVGIVPKVWPELEELIETTKFNRADVVNRAISIYAMVESYLRDGHQLVFRDPETGKEEIVKIV